MEYLPIGSVVALKDGGRPLMIYGRKQIRTDDGTNWDYLACFYPEGYLGNDDTVFFDADEIEAVLFSGYRTRIDQKMQELLNSRIKG